MAQAWVHCNVCMTQSFRELFMTSCGKVVCAKCKPRLAQSNCSNCKGPCNKTVQINDKAPKEVLRLFEDPSIQLKSVLKCVDFQKRQRRRLLAFYQHSYDKEKTKYQDAMKRKEELHSKLKSLESRKEEQERQVAQAKARNERLKAALVQQQQQIQEASKGSPFQVQRNPQQTKEALSSSFHGYEAIGQPNMMSTPFNSAKSNSVQGAEMFLSPSPNLNLSSTSRGFLEMKTPAAWHASKRHHSHRGSQDFIDRHRPSPRQKPSPLNVRHPNKPSPYDARVPHKPSPHDRAWSAGTRQHQADEVDPRSVYKFFSPP